MTADWRKERHGWIGEPGEEGFLRELLSRTDLPEEERAEVFFYLFLMYKRQGDQEKAQETAVQMLQFPEELRSYDFEVPNALWETFGDSEAALAYLRTCIPEGLTLEKLVEQWKLWASVLLLEREIQIAMGKASRREIDGLADAYIHIVPRADPLRRTMGRLPERTRRSFRFRETQDVVDQHYGK